MVWARNSHFTQVVSPWSLKSRSCSSNDVIAMSECRQHDILHLRISQELLGAYIKGIIAYKSKIHHWCEWSEKLCASAF